MMMVASVFAINASAATGEYVQAPASFYTEDFDGETHTFVGYSAGAAWTGGLAEGDTDEGNAYKMYDKSGQGAAVNMPANYTLEFDFCHAKEDVVATSCIKVFIADADSTATVKNFGMYIGLLPFTKDEWYTLKLVVDESKLTATGDTPSGAVTLYWKAKGAADWTLATQDTDNNFDSSTTLYYRSYSGFGNTLYGESAIGIGGADMVNGMVDNINAYAYEDVLAGANDYAAKEDFSGITYALTNVSVSDGVATTSGAAVVSADLPEKFVIEFDLQTSAAPYDVSFRDTDCADQPYCALRILGGSYDPTKTYTYKFIIDQSELVNDNGNTQAAAIDWYRKEAGTNTWVPGGLTTAFNSISVDESKANGYNMQNYNDSITGAKIDYTGGYVPVARLHNGVGATGIADKSVAFAANGTIDNIKISGLGAVRVFEFEKETALGATVEFNDADATDLSTARTIFVAAYNGDVLADVDFESVSAANGVYTAELGVAKATYDEIKVFVWETADNTPALPNVFDLGAWLD